MSFVAPVSTIPAVKCYLVAAVKMRPEIESPTLVTYGEPGTYLPRDIICVLDATQAFTVAAMVGSGATHWLDETYSIDIVVDCFLGGDDPRKVEERALYLAGIVVDVVRTDPSLGGLVIQAKPLSLRTSGAWEDKHKGRRGLVYLSFEILTQL